MTKHFDQTTSTDQTTTAAEAQRVIRAAGNAAANVERVRPLANNSRGHRMVCVLAQRPSEWVVWNVNISTGWVGTGHYTEDYAEAATIWNQR